MKKTGFASALGTLVYVIIVATMMQYGERLFGEKDNFLGPIAFLLLFTLSAVVVGGLILGRPMMLYFDGKKREAVALFVNTAAWLAGFTVLALISAVLIK